MARHSKVFVKMKARLLVTTEQKGISASCCLRTIKNSVFEELRVKRFAVIQEEMHSFLKVSYAEKEERKVMYHRHKDNGSWKEKK